jgi:hypothetical protein
VRRVDPPGKQELEVARDRRQRLDVGDLDEREAVLRGTCPKTPHELLVSS